MSLVQYSDSDDSESSAIPISSSSTGTDICNFFESDLTKKDGMDNGGKNSFDFQEQSLQIPNTPFWTSHLFDTDIIDCNLVPDNQEVTLSCKRKCPTNSKYEGETKVKKLSSIKESFDNQRQSFSNSMDKPAYVCPIMEKMSEYKAHSGPISRVAWSPQKRNSPELFCSGGLDHKVKVWRLVCSPSRVAASFNFEFVTEAAQHQAPVRGCVWPSEESVLTAGTDSTTRLWDLRTDEHSLCHHHLGDVSSVAMLCAPHTYLAGGKSLVTAWDLRAGERPVQSFVYRNHFGQVADIQVLVDSRHSERGGNQFVTCSDIVDRDASERTLMVWDVRTASPISGQIYQERFGCTRLAHHPGGKEFAAQTHGDYIALFSAVKPFSMNKRRRFEGHKVGGYPVGCAYRNDGAMLASGSSDGRVYLYDHRATSLVSQLSFDDDEAISSPVVELAWHRTRGRDLLACASWDGRIALFGGVG